jgi:hypothetical protein
VNTTVEIEFADRPPLTVEGSPGYNPVVRQTHSVDGALEEVAGRNGIDLDASGSVQMDGHAGPSDLGGEVWLDWDAEYLYLSANITDDTHHQPATGLQVWRGDSIQLGVTGDAPGQAETYTEFNVGLTEDGPHVHRMTQPTKENGRPVTDAQASIMRVDDAGRTAYEVAIPWSALGEGEAAPDALSVSLIVNDNDGSGRRGYVAWGGDIGGNKDPATFRRAQLVTDSTIGTSGPANDAATGERTTTGAPGFSAIGTALAVLVALLAGRRRS